MDGSEWAEMLVHSYYYNFRDYLILSHLLTCTGKTLIS